MIRWCWRGRSAPTGHHILVINVTMENDSYQVVRYMNFTTGEESVVIDFAIQLLGLCGWATCRMEAAHMHSESGYTVLFNKCKTLSTYSWASGSRAEGPDPTYAYCLRYASAPSSHASSSSHWGHAIIDIIIACFWSVQATYWTEQSFRFADHVAQIQLPRQVISSINPISPVSCSCLVLPSSIFGHWTLNVDLNGKENTIRIVRSNLARSASIAIRRAYVDFVFWLTVNLLVSMNPPSYIIFQLSSLRMRIGVWRIPVTGYFLLLFFPRRPTLFLGTRELFPAVR